MSKCKDFCSLEWQSKEGAVFACEMTDNHLENTIAFLKRKLNKLEDDINYTIGHGEEGEEYMIQKTDAQMWLFELRKEFVRRERKIPCLDYLVIEKYFIEDD